MGKYYILFGFILVRVYFKIWKWVYFFWSYVGFGGGGGYMGNGYLNIMNFLLIKRIGISKIDIWSENGRKMYGFNVMGIFIVECKLFESKIVFFLMDILRFFIKVLWILDKDGNGSDNDDDDEKDGSESCINNIIKSDVCFNKVIIEIV